MQLTGLGICWLTFLSWWIKISKSITFVSRNNNPILSMLQSIFFDKTSTSLSWKFSITLIHHLFRSSLASWKLAFLSLEIIPPHLQEFLATPATFQCQKPREGAITMCHQSWEAHLNGRPTPERRRGKRLPVCWAVVVFPSVPGACRLAENQKGGRSFFMTSMAARLPKVLPPIFLAKIGNWQLTMDEWMLLELIFQADIWRSFKIPEPF